MNYYIFQSLNNLTLKIQPFNILNQTTTTLVPESFCIQLPSETLLDKKQNQSSQAAAIPRALIQETDVDHEMDDDFRFNLVPRPLIIQILEDYDTDDDLPGDPVITHYRRDGTYFDDLAVRGILKIPTDESFFSEISPTASFTELDKACPSGAFMIGLATNPSSGLELLFVAKSREDVKELLDQHRLQSGNELKDYQNWTWRYTFDPAELIENLMERLNSKYELGKLLFLDKTGKLLNNCISESLLAIDENKNVSEGKLIEVKVACHPDDVIEEEKVPVLSKTTSEQGILKIFSACTLGKLDMFNIALATIAEKNRTDVLQQVRTKINKVKFLPQKEKALKNFDAFCATLISAEPSASPQALSSTRPNF